MSMKAVIGSTWNRLTVMERRHIVKTFKTGLVRKICEVYVLCTCGRTKWVRPEHLTGGVIVSCGCYNYEPRCADPEERAARRVLAYTRNSAKARALPFTVTIENLKSIIFLPCHYCGMAPTRSIGSARPYAGKNPPCHGVDRVDVSGGYTQDNIVQACAVCNTMKWTLSTEQFFAHIERIAARIPDLRTTP